MSEAIPGVNVQALAAFFSKHFEQSKTSTQPRQKNHKNKALMKLLEFSSKQDLTCRSADPPSFCRSVSSFDLSNSGKHSHIACKSENSFKRRQRLNRTCITSVPSTSSLVNGSISARKKLCQDSNCGLDTTSNDSGVDENSESSIIEDSRTNDQHILYPVSNFLPFSGSLQTQKSLPDGDGSKISRQLPSPTVNIIVKEPFLESNKCLQSNIVNGDKNVVTTVWNRTYEVDINTEIEKNLVNKPPPDRLFYSEIVVSDNYVCKTQYRRTELPPAEVLGPPPCKPKKLNNVKFPLLSLSSKSHFFQNEVLLPRAEGRTGGACYPLKKHIGEPSNQSSAQEHSEREFHQRILSDTSPKSSCSLQKQYLHESLEELSNKSKHDIVSSPPSLPPRRLSCPSYISEKSGSVSDIPGEELYHDAEVQDENLYEEVPFPNDCQSHIYVNHAKSNKTGKEMARLLQKENRERKYQEKELEKLRRKFGLTGEEVPLERGYIKKDVKGGRSDLAVKKGESVLIVRIVNNPIGRLLAQNERGKIGYVALDNLIVDADAIKTVMRERKQIMENKQRSYSTDSSNAYTTYEEY